MTAHNRQFTRLRTSLEKVDTSNGRGHRRVRLPKKVRSQWVYYGNGHSGTAQGCLSLSPRTDTFLNRLGVLERSTAGPAGRRLTVRQIIAHPVIAVCISYHSRSAAIFVVRRFTSCFSIPALARPTTTANTRLRRIGERCWTI